MFKISRIERRKSLPARATLATVTIAALAVVGTSVPAVSADDTDRVSGSNDMVYLPQALASGTVSDAKGRPVSDADVTVYVYPTKLPEEEGGRFQLLELGSTTTNEKGEYTLRADFDRVNSSHKKGVDIQEPYINVEILAEGEQGVSSFDTTIWMDADGTNARVTPDAFSEESERATALKTKRSNSGISLDMTLQSPDLSLEVPETTIGGVVVTALPTYAGCYLLGKWNNIDTTVGHLSTTKTSGYATQSLSFTAGSSVTTGVGVSLTGGAGTFSTSGTRTASTENNLTFRNHAKAGGELYKTKFNYAYVRCAHGTTGTYQYKVLIDTWGGGTSYISKAAPSATYCFNYNAGDVQSFSNSTAQNTASGVAFNTVLFTTTSRAGFTSKVKQTINVMSTSKLCGTTGNMSNPGKVVVK